MNKQDIKSMTLPELEEAFAALGEPKFRAGQVYTWLHEKYVQSFSEMTNISTKFRQVLTDHFYITSLKVLKRLVSRIDNTVKYLYALPDGRQIETVSMLYHHGRSICVSTQVGCKMGCTFCASTIAGFVRNLAPSEILEQIYETERDLGPISSVVLMGIGEPLDNFDNVMRFLELLSAPKGRNLSLRHVSLSTCGLVDKIDELANRRLGLTLSVSLHAPNDVIRRRTMPVAQKWPMEMLLASCRRYAELTSRRISFEYALIRGVNDSLDNADELAEKLRGMLCHVNLIPVNEVKERSYRASTRASVQAFMDRLTRRGIQTTVRRTLGADIQAACGQLRREHLDQTSDLPQEMQSTEKIGRADA